MNSEEKNLVSTHIFMFPFRFDRKGSNKELDDLQILSAVWKPIPFDPKNNIDNYNQLSYFNTYARDILCYNDSSAKKSNKQISQAFRRSIENDLFSIKIQNNNQIVTYDLTLDEVTLNLFFTGVAILSIKTSNYTYKNFDDILEINDFGRRVYPQFIGENGVADSKNTFLADSITLNGIVEDFENLNREKITVGKHIMALLGSDFSQDDATKRFSIEPLLDDRMYVMSWYGNNDLAKNIAKSEEDTLNNEEWYKYIFVDTNYPTVQNEKMKKELLSNATYFRWQKYNTLYGISKYSYVWLSENNEFVRDALVKHMHNLYHPMMLILLVTKASLYKYSDEIIDAELEGFQQQYEEYLMFYSKLNIQEITHQEQGYELYALARKQMNIDHLTEKLDNKFTKFFEYSELKSNQKNSKSMDKLTKLGAVFLPPSLTVALLSMGIFNYDKSYTSLFVGLGAIGLSAVLGYWAFIKEDKDEK